MSIISYDYLNKLQEKTNLFSLMPFIKNRRDRMCIESIFAIACFYTGCISVEKKNYSFLDLSTFKYNSDKSILESKSCKKYCLAR